MKMAAPRVWRYNEKRRQLLGKVGQVVAWTIVRAGPEGMEERTPYVVGIIEVDGQRVMGQVVDVDSVQMRVGMKVEGVLRRLFDVDSDALIMYGVKWRAINSH
jgi:uncharacterized OB-fold protein